MEIKTALLLRLKNIYADNIKLLESQNHSKNSFDYDYLNLYKSFALSTARLKEIISEIENTN